MATTTNSGSDGDQTPSSGQAPKKSVVQQSSSSSSSIPLSGDGKTPPKATWSPSLSLAPNTKKTYVVDGLGLVPRFRRTTLIEARSAAQSYAVLDGDTYHVVLNLPPGPMANSTTPTMTDVPQQLAGVVAQENVVAAGSGPAAQQYYTSQAHRI
jgi:hypothetical protein